MTPDLIIKLIGDLLVAAVLFYFVSRFESGEIQSGRVVTQQQRTLIDEMRAQTKELIEAMRQQGEARTEVMMARIVAAIEQRLDEHHQATAEAHDKILSRIEKRW